MPGGIEDFLDRVAWEEGFDISSSVPRGGGGGEGKADDVAEVMRLGGSACLRWL